MCKPDPNNNSLSCSSFKVSKIIPHLIKEKNMWFSCKLRISLIIQISLTIKYKIILNYCLSININFHRYELLLYSKFAKSLNKNTKRNTHFLHLTPCILKLCSKLEQTLWKPKKEKSFSALPFNLVSKSNFIITFRVTELLMFTFYRKKKVL